MRTPLAFTVAVFAAGVLSAEAQLSRVSVVTGGAQANGLSLGAAVSGDGRIVVFSSNATNLDPAKCPVRGLFVHNRDSGQTVCITVGLDNAPANGGSIHPAVNADGTVIAFTSIATNLVEDDRNASDDVFVYSLGTITRVSVANNGSEANGPSGEASISADGRYVAFTSSATNLVTGDNNNRRDVFVRDLLDNRTHMVSFANGGASGDNHSDKPAISGDGKFVAFQSLATNLVAGDTNGVSDVFLRELTGNTTRISIAADGGQSFAASLNPSLSHDGGLVAFESRDSLVLPDRFNFSDVFVRDWRAPLTVRVSVSISGAAPAGNSVRARISADGTSVAFESDAWDLVAGDSNLLRDVFVRQLDPPSTTRVSIANNGSQADWPSREVAFSANGEVVVFTSDATNLVPSDTNGASDIFAAVRQRGELPGAPSNLRARLVGAELTLDWDPPAGGAPFDSYLLAVYADNTTGFSRLVNINTTAPTFRVVGVPRGDFLVYVQAVNRFGPGPQSNPVSLGPPSHMLLGPAAVADSDVRFTWQPSATWRLPATNHVFYVGLRPFDWAFRFSTGSEATSYLRSNVPPGIYYVRVAGENAFGEGEWSNQIMVQVRSCSEPPNAPTGLAGWVAPPFVTFSWQHASGCPATSYVMVVGDASGAANLGAFDVGSGTSTTLRTTGVPRGTYYVRLVAYNEFGASPFSNEVTVVIP